MLEDIEQLARSYITIVVEDENGLSYLNGVNNNPFWSSKGEEYVIGLADGLHFASIRHCWFDSFDFLILVLRKTNLNCSHDTNYKFIVHVFRKLMRSKYGISKSIYVCMQYLEYYDSDWVRLGYKLLEHLHFFTVCQEKLKDLEN